MRATVPILFLPPQRCGSVFHELKTPGSSRASQCPVPATQHKFLLIVGDGARILRKPWGIVYRVFRDPNEGAEMKTRVGIGITLACLAAGLYPILSMHGARAQTNDQTPASLAELENLP